ncbi:hypothetical protein BH11PAT2_BH11PAT2_01760 [soil metagenome]
MNTFSVGTITNPLKAVLDVRRPTFSTVQLQYPSRLNAMALDPSKINITEDGIYAPGEVIFSISLYKNVTMRVREDSEIVISESSPRHQLIQHAALLMRSALHTECGFDIDVEAEDLRHCGLGSSSGLIATVAAAINELFGNPIPKIELMAYLAQNHGEEIDGDSERLQHVQCIGGSAAAGLVEAGMTVLAGGSVPIGTMNIDNSYSVLIGIPNEFSAPDAQELMRLELLNMKKFLATGNTYRDLIGYRVTHEMLPNMKLGNLREASKLIFDYRFDYGSIDNCSFVLPRLNEIAVKVRVLFENSLADVLALSSVGPAFFAITKHPDECEKVFVENDMTVRRVRVNNTGYTILNRA